MANKYFCWNIDDGTQQDKKVIEILRSFHMGATFNLNAGLFGQKSMIGRIGDYGIKTVLMEQYQAGSFPSLQFSESSRIPADEIVQVYEGFEVASHGFRHENLEKVSCEEAEASIRTDVAELRKLFSQPICGFAYPYGACTADSQRVLEQEGIRYARTIARADGFRLPSDPLHLSMNGWHLDPDIFDKLDAFIAAEPQEEDLFFLMFAHGYEFDFQTANCNWEKLRRICDKVASHTDILCCSTGQALGFLPVT